MTTVTNTMRPVSIISMLAGMWLFVSPWIYGASASPNAWNSWIVGLIIFVVASVRLNQAGPAGLSWLNAILGVWTFASPWVFGYTGHPGRLVNSLCVGAIVFVAALINANSMHHGGGQPTQRTA